MKPKVKEKWLKALRSGEYKQTKGQLKDEKGYCCLGVLCELHRKTVKQKGCKWNLYNSYLGTGSILPEKVMKWAGMETESGRLPKRIERKSKYAHNLIDLNDTLNFSFKQIAQVIEKQF